MQNETNKQGEDTLNSQSSSEKTLNNGYIMTYEKIKGTPFTLVRHEMNWFIALGNNRITTPTETKEETLEKLETEKWEIVMHLAIIAVTKTKEFEKLPPEEKKRYEEDTSSIEEWKTKMEKQGERLKHHDEMIEKHAKTAGDIIDFQGDAEDFGM